MPKKPQAKDPYEASLDEQFEKCGALESRHAQGLLNLYICHLQKPRTPFLAMNAMVLAGEIGIPAPMWAVKLINKAIHDYITSPDVKSLDIALGFKGKGTGKTRGAEAPQRLRKVMLERLCARVHILVAGGRSKTEACRLVSREVKALFSADGNSSSSLWVTNCYGIKPPNEETLLRLYRKWEESQKEAYDAEQVVSGQKDIEDLTSLTNSLLNLIRSYLANPSQPLDETTICALKEFLKSLQPKPTISHT
jgi:hypothetical protein